MSFLKRNIEEILVNVSFEDLEIYWNLFFVTKLFTLLDANVSSRTSTRRLQANWKVPSARSTTAATWITAPWTRPARTARTVLSASASPATWTSDRAWTRRNLPRWIKWHGNNSASIVWRMGLAISETWFCFSKFFKKKNEKIPRKWYAKLGWWWE